MTTDMRNEPLPAGQHLARDLREARLIRRPRIAQTQTGPEQNESDHEQDEAIASPMSGASNRCVSHQDFRC